MSAHLFRPHTKWPVAAGLGIAGSVIVVLIVLAFLWPAKTTSAQHLPVNIVGSPSTVTAVQDAVTAQFPGTFEFVGASDRSDAVAQIKGRETYGAIILDDGRLTPEVLTAPAAGPSTAQMLNGVATQLQTQFAQRVAAAGGNVAAAKVTVTPVVPLSERDPTGSGLVSASFPLIMGGMAGGVLISLRVVGAIRRLVTLAGLAVSVGLVPTLVLQTWFGFLQGDFWINAAAIALSVLATASFIIGCASLLGTKGISIGAILTMFVGNPLSAPGTPWQFLPEPWGVLGQLFVPGASNWLIRSVSYFPSADLTAQWWILIAWTAVGLALTLAAHFRARAATHVQASTLDAPEQQPVTASAAVRR